MDKKSKNKYVDELTSSICQLSQTLIDEKIYSNKNSKYQNDEMLSYELVSIFGETYKSLKLLNKDHLIDDFDRYINKKNILKGKYRVVLDCIKFADDPNQFQKIIKYHEDPIQVFKTTRQISDYLNLSGNVDKANFLHLDLLGQNDYRNTKLSDQLDVYNNYYDMRLLDLKLII